MTWISNYNFTISSHYLIFFRYIQFINRFKCPNIKLLNSLISIVCELYAICIFHCISLNHIFWSLVLDLREQILFCWLISTKIGEEKSNVYCILFQTFQNYLDSIVMKWIPRAIWCRRPYLWLVDSMPPPMMRPPMVRLSSSGTIGSVYPF